MTEDKPRSATTRIWLARREEYRCRYCLIDFASHDEAVGYCVYSRDGQHDIERRPRW